MRRHMTALLALAALPVTADGQEKRDMSLPEIIAQL